MKAAKRYLLLLCCFVCMHTYAQEAVALSHYIFSTFSQGKVQQKNGNVSDTNVKN